MNTLSQGAYFLISPVQIYIAVMISTPPDTKISKLFKYRAYERLRKCMFINMLKFGICP